MKRILVVLSLILTMGLVGCSSGSEYKNVSTSNIKKAIESSNLLVEQPTEFEFKDGKFVYKDDTSLNFDYFNDILDKVKEGFIIRAAINVRLEDVIVIKTDDVDTVFTALEGYKKDMIDRLFGLGYGAEENADIAANTIIEKKGNYVYLISAKNAKSIEEKILEVIKK